jgi:hypothetical protein
MKMKFLKDLNDSDEKKEKVMKINLKKKRWK